MRDRQVCIDCGKKSPETETNYTLISAQFGWRLTRRRAHNGDFIVEWRCAECWRDHKKKTEEEAPSKTHAKVPEKPQERHRPSTPSTLAGPHAGPHPGPRAPGAGAPTPRASSRPPTKPASSRPPPATSRPSTSPPPTPGTRPRRP
jgi:hypothetical protein